MKYCSGCEKEKPFAEFYKNKAQASGYSVYCKICHNARSKKYNDENKDKIKEIKDRYCEKHPERVKESKRAWDMENKESRNANRRKYIKRYPQKVNANNRRRVASKKNAMPKWFEADLVGLVYEKASIMGFHVDHIVPLQSDLVCGLHCWHNLQVLAPEVNMSKGNRHWPDMP